MKKNEILGKINELILILLFLKNKILKIHLKIFYLHWELMTPHTCIYIV